MPESKKTVGEIFNDYQTKSLIKEANIGSLNVVKKTNTLGITLIANNYIEIKEIWYFEKFLLERFKFSNIDLKIEYDKNTKLKSVQEEWRNIICYMAHKYPLMKPMLLMKSDIEVKQNDISIQMHIPGADFLRAKKTDIQLQNVLEKLFGIKYHITIEEKINKQEILEIQENVKKIEEEAIENHSFAIKEELEVQETQENIPPLDDSDYIPTNEEELGIPVEELPQTQNYILGKASKAKENIIKIKDINAESGRITIEGRIISSDCKETKSGKGMLIYDIYDGTGIITCKSFAKDANEGNEMLEKIKNAKAIKTTGKAGLDTFAGDVTVISNIIIETDADVPELPEEDDSTPLIFGKNMNIIEPLVKISDLGAEDRKSFFRW